MDFNVDIERIKTIKKAYRDGFKWVVLNFNKEFLSFATSRDLISAHGEYFYETLNYISDLEHELMLHTHVVLHLDGSLYRHPDGLFIKKINADLSLLDLTFDKPFLAYDIPLSFNVFFKNIYPELL